MHDKKKRVKVELFKEIQTYWKSHKTSCLPTYKADIDVMSQYNLFSNNFLSDKN